MGIYSQWVVTGKALRGELFERRKDFAASDSVIHVLLAQSVGHLYQFQILSDGNPASQPDCNWLNTCRAESKTLELLHTPCSISIVNVHVHFSTTKSGHLMSWFRTCQHIFFNMLLQSSQVIDSMK